jgi:mannose-6-phosphate isomerase-like protein (cupin superfamily)
MQRLELGDDPPDWKVCVTTKRSQAAIMVLEPGDKEGGPDNTHDHSDQWLFVVDGRGTAIVEGETIELAPGVLLLVEAGERHEIRASDDVALRTLNVYATPAY